ncbi:MAG TPA: ribonuclease III [Vicinamibacterales bacterium]|nr:ribonuclease III [Vicinamibacterales bacterium]
MEEVVVVFRTPSQIEADVVRGLLEANGVVAMVSADISRTPFPLSVHEHRVSVAAGDASEALRIIESHRDDRGSSKGKPFGAELEPLEKRIGYRFRDRGLLEHALTHRSRVHEDASGGVFDNESLEFLGDSVLGFLIADMLFRQFPQHNEGQKSKLKASIVSATSLARLAERLGLGEFLILGRGEEKTGGRRKHALIADCYEALIAAIYLDGGIDAVRGFVQRQFQELIEEARRSGAEAAFTADYKSALQERLQQAGKGLPVYRLTAELGPPHRRRFEVEVLVNDEVVGKAEGGSKKEAAQAAARAALALLRDD